MVGQPDVVPALRPVPPGEVVLYVALKLQKHVRGLKGAQLQGSVPPGCVCPGKHREDEAAGVGRHVEEVSLL
eukprot:CAMPEP_0202911650 /NCGR_PEP_ID=MMETSP1392-20130828/55569_1 /ASSEMBLY_ACC=CAM_ASM_000868 /TAXON_ID=225041 /ORGANISM="Chlamydomonas chlamydogama, Strain SAG 11-48b" /LENGTH=71 /DNA_ID=CAMNT_0049602243 /DNA_START=61 /DNA_END=272 /DNA_ORIENTATION=-